VGVAAGCASEAWDNPYDPDSSAFRAPCAGVPGENAEGCIFWEDFDHGLTRWNVNGSPSGMSPIRVVPQSDDGVSTVLALPGCAEQGSPALQTELDWHEAPETMGELSLKVNGASQFVSNETAGEEGYEKWYASIANLTPLAGRTVILQMENAAGQGASCATDGIYVARVHLRKLPQ
jgi:hypothetical protein